MEILQLTSTKVMLSTDDGLREYYNLVADRRAMQHAISSELYDTILAYWGVVEDEIQGVITTPGDIEITYNPSPGASDAETFTVTVAPEYASLSPTIPNLTGVKWGKIAIIPFSGVSVPTALSTSYRVWEVPDDVLPKVSCRNTLTTSNAGTTCVLAVIGGSLTRPGEADNYNNIWLSSDVPAGSILRGALVWIIE